MPTQLEEVLVLASRLSPLDKVRLLVKVAETLESDLLSNTPSGGSAITGSCRDEILESAQEIVRQKGKNEFTPAEIIEYMRNKGTHCSDQTIRTHITSGKMTVGLAKYHGTTYEDFEQISRGVYRILDPNV